MTFFVTQTHAVLATLLPSQQSAQYPVTHLTAFPTARPGNSLSKVSNCPSSRGNGGKPEASVPVHVAQSAGMQGMDSISKVFSSLNDSVKRKIPTEKERQAAPSRAVWISKARKTRPDPPRAQRLLMDLSHHQTCKTDQIPNSTRVTAKPNTCYGSKSCCSLSHRFLELSRLVHTSASE